MPLLSSFLLLVQKLRKILGALSDEILGLRDDYFLVAVALVFINYNDRRADRPASVKEITH